MENNNLLNKDHQIKISWIKIQSEMKEKFGTDIYDSWLKKITYEEEFDNYILLSVTTRFIRDWITSRYLDEILKIVKRYKSEINRIELTLNEQANNILSRNSEEIGKSKKFKNNISFIKDFVFQYNRIDPNRTFENFITSTSNKLAFEASKKVAEKSSYYNPLYIYSGVGMGKTHLLNAIGHKLKDENKVMFISA